MLIFFLSPWWSRAQVRWFEYLDFLTPAQSPSPKACKGVPSKAFSLWMRTWWPEPWKVNHLPNKTLGSGDPRPGCGAVAVDMHTAQSIAAEGRTSVRPVGRIFRANAESANSTSAFPTARLHLFFWRLSHLFSFILVALWWVDMYTQGLREEVTCFWSQRNKSRRAALIQVFFMPGTVLNVFHELFDFLFLTIL